MNTMQSCSNHYLCRGTSQTAKWLMAYSRKLFFAKKLYHRCLGGFKSSSPSIIQLKLSHQDFIWLVRAFSYVSTTGISIKVHSCKLYNNKYMITSSQITTTEIFTFKAVLVYKLLSCKILFINRKENRKC